MNAFPARYPGLCNPCGEDIKPGESITGHPDAGFIHEECAEDVGKAPEMAAEHRVRDDPTRRAMPRGKTAQDRCDGCFQIPSNNGSCGCF